MISSELRILLIIVLGMSCVALLLFGIDKFQARRGGRRVPEIHLCLIGALGGWPGGLLAMLLFRHKTAKGSFIAKFSVAFVIWAAGLAWGIAHCG